MVSMQTQAFVRIVGGVLEDFFLESGSDTCFRCVTLAVGCCITSHIKMAKLETRRPVKKLMQSREDVMEFWTKW